MNISIVQAEDKDFDSLYKLWEETQLFLRPKESEYKAFSSMRRLHPELLFVCKDTHITIGSLLGGFDGRSASIHRFAVSPLYQKMGIGSKLLQQFETACTQLDIQKVILEVDKTHSDIIEYYENKGFKKETYTVMMSKKT